MASTLNEFIASQDHLIREAALALPHQFSQCTYSLGPIRQAVYLCTTCPEARGVCSACSIACHTNHEQVELFPKRNFRCDCPTTSMAHSCTLHRKLEEENTLNVYSQNFKGFFCRCGRTYDASKERETMIQCLACEDWFHESCCNLRERLSSRDPSPEPSSELCAVASVVGEDIDQDAISEASSLGPPRLISEDQYENFVCADCVARIPTLVRWAGTPGVMIIVRKNVSDPWICVNDIGETSEGVVNVDGNPEQSPSLLRTKRPLSPSSESSDIPDAKRARGSLTSSDLDPTPTSKCLAPPPNPLAQMIFSGRHSPSTDPAGSLGTGDVFLTEGFRTRWCRCDSCFPSLEANPYLLQEEETYEPPEDPDSGLSLEELGLRALANLPRDRAIDGIHAFNEMRDDLVQFLRPFAQEGKVVHDSDVKDFFASLTEAAKKGRR